MQHGAVVRIRRDLQKALIDIINRRGYSTAALSQLWQQPETEIHDLRETYFNDLGIERLIFCLDRLGFDLDIRLRTLAHPFRTAKRRWKDPRRDPGK